MARSWQLKLQFLSFFADVFEAVEGAIIIDANLSFETLERVYARFMTPVYGKFIFKDHLLSY
jgi:dsRNA-specific ribonuclease